MRSKGNTLEGVQAFVDRLELLERLAAIVDELDVLDADTDVPRTLALGLLEDVEREFAATAPHATGGGMTPDWTAADQAELDVLTHALVFDFSEHRKHCEACRPEPCPDLEAWKAHKAECRACQGDAPLTFGLPCERHEQFLDHNRRGCPRCLPCPHLQAAIAEVLEWREARILLSRAEALRAEAEERAA